MNLTPILCTRCGGGQHGITTTTCGHFEPPTIPKPLQSTSCRLVIQSVLVSLCKSNLCHGRLPKSYVPKTEYVNATWVPLIVVNLSNNHIAGGIQLIKQTCRYVKVTGDC